MRRSHTPLLAGLTLLASTALAHATCPSGAITFSALQTEITSCIYSNGAKAITGSIEQQVLMDILNYANTLTNAGQATLTQGTTATSGFTDGDILSSTAGVLQQLGVTGSGSVVEATSPTLVTPNLGTPSAVNLANGTNLPIGSITGFGSSVATALATAIGNAGAPVLFNGALGTPASGNLANATNYPLANLTGLGTGVAAALADAVGGAGAVLTFNGAAGTPSSITLTNGTGLPIAGLTGLGTGEAAALAVASNTSGGHALIASAPLVGDYVKWSASGLQDGGSGPSNSITFAATCPSSSTTGNSITLNNGANPIAYSTSHTMAASECGSVIEASGASTTITGLASITSGYEFTVINEDATHNVTVAPGGSNTFNGSASNITLPPGQAIGISAGSGGSPTNWDVAGVPSTASTMAIGGTVTSGTSGDILSVGSGPVLSQVAVTGSGSVVEATSPTLTTPALGTPSAVVLTHGTGLPISTGLSGAGTGVLTALGSAVTGSGGPVLATSPTLTTPNLGTPSAVNLANATNLPVSALNSGTSASSTTFWRGDGTWAAPSAAGTIDGPGYQASTWYLPALWDYSAGGALSITTTYCTPGWIRTISPTGGGSGTIGGLSDFISTAGTTNVQFALYANDATVSPNRPGTLLGNSASVANTSSTWVTGTVSISGVTPGLYWWCGQTDDTTGKWYARSGGNTDTWNATTVGGAAPSNVISTSGMGGVSTPGTFGTWPSSLHGSTWTSITNTSPILAFQFSSIP